MEHHLSGVAAKVSLSLFHELAVLECFSKEHFLVKFIIKIIVSSIQTKKSTGPAMCVTFDIYCTCIV